jgi:hypothetical protein
METDHPRAAARDRLISVFREAVDLLRTDDPAVLGELLEHLEQTAEVRGKNEGPAAWLARRLDIFAERHERERAHPADLMGLAADPAGEATGPRR